MLRTIAIFIAFLGFAAGASAQGRMPGQVTVFNAGDDGVNSYRIPSVAVAPDGSILVFCEARRLSWQDKSRTDVVMKRSTDGGATWSEMVDLTKGTTGAFMDPVPVVDETTGEIILFASFWPENDHSGATNRMITVSSRDNGATWSEPEDVTGRVLPDGRYIYGFGPGAGLQMKGGKHAGRLIMPARISDSSHSSAHDVAFYSDDHGATWKVGGNGTTSNEFQIAESPAGELVYNARDAGARYVARSSDGGETWSEAVVDSVLPGVSKGCQASVLGAGPRLLFSGIQGIPETPDFDERASLALYTSHDGGVTWGKPEIVYPLGAGYSCLTRLADGSLGIVFEAADTRGFTRKSIPDTMPRQRPAGWMRIDFIPLGDR